MTIVIEDLQMEQLARNIAKAEGISVIEAVHESLLSLAGIRGLTAKKPSLRERLAKLACEVDTVPRQPLANNLDDNDILGYNEHGTW